MASPFVDYPSILRHLETRLLVADLKDILKELHLSTSGNKRPLIDRVASQLALLKSANDVARYTSLKNRILRCGSPSMPMQPMRGIPMRPVMPSSSTNEHRPPTNGMPYNQFAGNNWRPPGAYSQQQATLNFKPSPFYEVIERLSNTATLPFSPRNTVSMSFVCTMNALDLLHQGTTKYKVAIMCAESTYAYNPNRQLLMEFPNPAEVLVNAKRLHANLKGMKNKPGTIPPADITSYIDRTPRLPNRVDITYSCGGEVNKKFGVQVVLLKVHSVDELVEKIKAGNRFTKESVLGKLRKPEDDDIEMASFDLTLKDPLSYMRITVPCRSTFCKHNQCWDAMAFLSINEQTPQWTCPICHIAINGLMSIAVDGYFQDILDNVSHDVDTILVDPQGNWKVPGSTDKDDEQTRAEPREGDDALKEVLDLQDTEDEDETPVAFPSLPFHMKQEPNSRSSTPMLPSRTNKRKASPVCIDLTEDSDEEAEQLKKHKPNDSTISPAATALTPFPSRTIVPDLPSSAHAIPRTSNSQARTVPANESGQNYGLQHRPVANDPSVSKSDTNLVPPVAMPLQADNVSGSTEAQPVTSTAMTGITNGDTHHNDSAQETPDNHNAAKARAVDSEISSHNAANHNHGVGYDNNAQHEQRGNVSQDYALPANTISTAEQAVPRQASTSELVENGADQINVPHSNARGRYDEDSPPIVVPGAHKSAVPPSAQTLFSDDFSDGDQDFY